MPVTVLEVRDLYDRRWREFFRECSEAAIVALVAQEMQIDASAVRHAIGTCCSICGASLGSKAIADAHFDVRHGGHGQSILVLEEEEE